MNFISIVENIRSLSLLHPKKTAIVSKGVALSYEDLFLRIWSVKDYLDIYQLRNGDTVVLAATKNIHFIFCYFALHLLKVKVVPLDATIPVTRLEYIIEKVKPQLVIGLHQEGNISAIDYNDIEDLDVLSVPDDINFPSKGDIADILFTSGSTGLPKGVILTHGNISASARNINSFIGNTINDVELLALPISHSFGLGRIKCVLSIGGTLVLVGSMVRLKSIFKAFEKYKITGFGMVPASWNYLRKMSGNKLSNYADQLNYFELGSAYMSKEEKLNLMELFPNTRICMHYGLTEASRSTFLEFHSDIEFIETIGKASPNVDISILDEKGNKVANGVEAEICIRGEHVSTSYLDHTQDEKFHNEFFRSGDIGRINDEGFISLEGRKTDLINVGGKKVAPIEVELALKGLDPSLDSACIGIKDPNGVLGEVVKIFIVRNDSSVSLESIKKYLESNLESYKVPLEYELIDDLPRTSSGKLQRQKLK